GLVEQGGWVDYTRCETLWVLGDWAAARAAGERALAVGERNAYQRLAFRTFLVLLPMAESQQDASVADHWDGWWQSAADSFPAEMSPYGRVMLAAVDIWLHRLRGRPVAPPDDSLAGALMATGNPHYLAGVEAIAGAWLDVGRRDLVERAAEVVAHAGEESDDCRLPWASASLLRAWLTGSPADIETARRLAVEAQAPWWADRAR
ncbi:MAG: hypothetical protein QOJ60_910, partial [Actinomycetota bacterium]|nr:hypothetical protein [Actinomycetota bacterium]